MAGRVQVPCGSFFETSGILFYLWLYRIPMPIFSTGFIQTPEIAGFRSIVNTVLFFTFFYLGFIRSGEAVRPLDRVAEASGLIEEPACD